jgi:hypothetical protein
MASGNYCKTLSAIQRSNQKLWPFWAVITVWRDNTSSSMSRDSICATRKTASENYCRTLSTIQRSIQNLWPFSAVIPVWRDKTSSSTSRDSIGTTRKTAFGNTCRTLSAIQRSYQNLWPFFSCYSGLARQDLLFNEVEFHSYYKENGLKKLLYNFERDSTVRSKFMALFSCYSGLAWQDLHFNE